MGSLGTLLLSFVAVSFQGGDVSELARSIAEATKQNVVFQAGQQERAPAFIYDPADLNEFARVVQKATGFKRAPGNEHVFHHGRLPSMNFGVRAVQRVFNDQAWLNGGAVPDGALKEGKVTIQHKSGQATKLESLSGLLPKPIEMHWLIENWAVKSWVAGMPAEDFMKVVAKAAGGRLLQQKDRFALDIDPGEIQRRALATLAEAQKQKNYAQVPPREQMQLELSRSMLGGLSAAQVSHVLATPDGNLRLEIGAGMRPVIQRYIQVLMTPQQEQSRQGWQQVDEQTAQAMEEKMRAIELVTQDIAIQRGQRGERGDEDRGSRFNANMLRRMDPRILGYATIDATFRVRVEVLTLDNLGRPSRLVPLP